jgi:hypothetical protein
MNEKLENQVEFNALLRTHVILAKYHINLDSVEEILVEVNRLQLVYIFNSIPLLLSIVMLYYSCHFSTSQR